MLTVETGKQTTGLLVPISTDTGQYRAIPDTIIGLTLIIVITVSKQNIDLILIMKLNAINTFFLRIVYIELLNNGYDFRFVCQ